MYMSPTLSKSSVIWHFDIGDALEIFHRIIFSFYQGLSRMIFVNPHTSPYKDLQCGMVGAPTHVHSLAGIITVLNMPNI